MALYAANNISSAVRNLRIAVAEYLGIVLNHGNVENERKKVQAFCRKNSIPIVGEVRSEVRSSDGRIRAKQ